MVVGGAFFVGCFAMCPAEGGHLRGFSAGVERAFQRPINRTVPPWLRYPLDFAGA